MGIGSVQPLRARSSGHRRPTSFQKLKVGTTCLGGQLRSQVEKHEPSSLVETWEQTRPHTDIHRDCRPGTDSHSVARADIRSGPELGATVDCRLRSCCCPRWRLRSNGRGHVSLGPYHLKKEEEEEAESCWWMVSPTL